MNVDDFIYELSLLSNKYGFYVGSDNYSTYLKTEEGILWTKIKYNKEERKYEKVEEKKQ